MGQSSALLEMETASAAAPEVNMNLMFCNYLQKSPKGFCIAFASAQKQNKHRREKK